MVPLRKKVLKYGTPEPRFERVTTKALRVPLNGCYGGFGLGLGFFWGVWPEFNLFWGCRGLGCLGCSWCWCFGVSDFFGVWGFGGFADVGFRQFGGVFGALGL